MAHMTTVSLALALSLTVTFPLGAQRVERAPSMPATAQGAGAVPPASRAPTRQDAAPMVVGGTIGSFAGLWAGLHLAAKHGGNSGLFVLPSLLGASALGTALGIELGSGGSVPFSDAMSAALVGTLAGVGTAYLLGPTGDAGWSGLAMGYSISQGTLAGLVASLAGDTRGGGGR